MASAIEIMTVRIKNLSAQDDTYPDADDSAELQVTVRNTGSTRLNRFRGTLYAEVDGEDVNLWDLPLQETDEDVLPGGTGGSNGITVVTYTLDLSWVLRGKSSKLFGSSGNLQRRYVPLWVRMSANHWGNVDTICEADSKGIADNMAGLLNRRYAPYFSEPLQVSRASAKDDGWVYDDEGRLALLETAMDSQTYTGYVDADVGNGFQKASHKALCAALKFLTMKVYYARGWWQLPSNGLRVGEFWDYWRQNQELGYAGEIELSAADAEKLIRGTGGGNKDNRVILSDSGTGARVDIDTGHPYTFFLEYGDEYENCWIVGRVDTAFANVHMSGCGKGVAIGKFSSSTEEDPLLECAYPAVFEGDVDVAGAASVGGALTLRGDVSVANASTLFMVRTKTINVGTIAANGASNGLQALDVRMDGYIPIGIVGLRCSNSYIVITYSQLLNNQTFRVYLRNISNAQRTDITVDGDILYVRAAN